MEQVVPMTLIFGYRWYISFMIIYTFILDCYPVTRIPVSYTHLDVYKRQALEGARPRQSYKLGTPTPSESCNSLPIGAV